MSDLISRKALIETIVNTPTEQSGYNPVYLNGCATRQNEIIDIITKLPPVEAVPVVHGEWLHRSYGFVICSECGNIIERLRRTDFCSNCGADMRKKV